MEAATITNVQSRLMQMIANVKPEMPKPNKVVVSMLTVDLLWQKYQASIQGIMKTRKWDCWMN